MVLGYLPKKPCPPPEWLDGTGVTDVASVSTCIAAGPEHLPDGGPNRWGLFSDPHSARASIPSGDPTEYRIYGYRMSPTLFTRDGESHMDLGPEVASPIPSGFERVGWDAVSSSSGQWLECSPLSCNGVARERTVNSLCLFDTKSAAERLAREAEDAGCEPGPYYVVEVFRSDA